MHTNTASNCPSRFTVDDTLVLTCIRPVERHTFNARGQLMHIGKAYGVNWGWNDGEADQ